MLVRFASRLTGTVYRHEASSIGKQASNRMSMKSVLQNLSREIEFLRALAELYEQNNDTQAREATISSVAALERLLDIINKQNNESHRSLPLVA